MLSPNKAAVFIVILAVSMLYVSTVPASVPNAETGPQLLYRLEAEFSQATAARGSEGFASYFAEDATISNPGRPFIRGLAAIRRSLPPGPMNLTWKPEFAEMSSSGDLGYTFGYWESRGTDKDGKEVVTYGKYMTVWKKQKDGSWKVAFDGGNYGPDPAERK